MESRTRRAASKNTRAKVTVIVLSLLMLSGIAAMFVLYQFTSDMRIYEGVYVDNIPLGGMKPEEAAEKISSRNRQRLNDFRLTLSYGDNKWVFYHFDIGGSFNSDEIAAEAYAAGREGSVFDRLGLSRRLKNEPVRLYTTFSYDNDKLISHLEKIKGLLDIQPEDAVLEFLPDEDVKFIIKPEKTGFDLDIAGIKRQVDRELKNGSLKIDIELEPETVEPKVKAADFHGKTEKLITFGTDLSSSTPDRTHNVLLAASQFNGLIVDPGEVVSFNGVVGERTKEKGYRAAPMIKADKSLEDAIGGGVSQTSTTLFNAALRSGMEIMEFTRHSFPISYIGKGLDTTVNLPSPVIDLKFRNSKKSPVYIRSFFDDNKVYFEFFGEPLPAGQTIRIRTEEYETVPAPEPEYIPDTEGKYVKYVDEEFEKVKSRDGYKVRLFRELYDGDTLIDSQLIDDHYYRPIKGQIYTGIEERPVQPGDDQNQENNGSGQDNNGNGDEDEIDIDIINTVP